MQEQLRMQLLAGIITESQYKAKLNEIKISKPSPLNYLLGLQSKFKATQDPKERLSLTIQCAERVLFIWEDKYPNDKRPRKAIEVAKAYLENPTEENKKAAMYASDAARDAAGYYDDYRDMEGNMIYDEDEDEDEDDPDMEERDADAYFAALAAQGAASTAFNYPKYANGVQDAIWAVKEYYNPGSIRK
jgi:hypothetical protein